MRLFYCGAPECSIPTLKRLMVLGKALCFSDRPSVSLGTRGFTGTVGVESSFRRINSSGEPVTIEVYEPPSGPAGPVYQKFIEADFYNPKFIEIVIEGVRSSDVFASKIVQLEANYGSGVTGRVMRDAVAAIEPLPQSIEPTFDGVPYGVETHDPLDYLKWMMLEASIETTVAQLVAEQAEALPISDDTVMARLLALRTSGKNYNASATTLAPYLGIEFAKAVLPDEVLQRLDFTDILAYRRATADAYDAWQTEIDRLSAEMGQVGETDAQGAVARKIVTDLMPSVQAYKAEIKSVTERFYGDALKNVVRLDLPSIAVAYITGHGLLDAAIAFASTAFAGVAVPAIEHILSVNKAQRKHAVSYVINLTG